uniref:GTD-binding domain-containing protein n=1 Tax=Fagus sylvatica TaxID=28930 RepID=A0A2N9G5K0_FAGSY
MSCKAIRCWTFSGLVGAFVDVGIVFFLLCASTLAYFASIFLSFFGLSLPCSCNRLFGNPITTCFKDKFPFDSILAEQPNSQFNTELLDERNHKKRHVMLGDEQEEACQGQRKGLGLRRRHRGRFVDNGKSSSIPSFCLDTPRTPSCVGNIGIEITEQGSSVPVDSGDGLEAPVEICLQGRVSHGLELNESADENKSVEEALPVAEFWSNVQRKLGFDSDETNTIRVLEQALEEEHAARAALYLELEKERSAAATAADETMAMILRLQEEKALIGMEAKQYQRLIEEKSTYDAEEMKILKEILLRREREKHFLEKEVEAYRQMMFGNDQLDADMEATQTQGTSSLLYSREDPMVMLQLISRSMCEEEKVKNTSSSRDYDITSFDLQNRTIAFGKELPYPELDDAADVSKGDIHRHPGTDKHPDFLSCDDFQEKGMVFLDENPLTQQRELHTQEACSQSNHSSTQGSNLHVESINPVGEGQGQSDNIILSQQLATMMIEPCNEDKVVIPFNVDYVEMPRKDINQENKVSRSSVSDTELHVHVIDDESSMSNEVSVNKSLQLSRNASLKLHKKDDSLTLSKLETELDFKRSRSDLNSGLPPKAPARSKTLVSDLRRNSMSAIDLRRNSMSSIDYERLKIDNEVEWLQQRLRIVQDGREKLNLSLGHKEREKIQLKLLEDIARQLQEIRQLTEPKQAIRQASLSPPFSTDQFSIEFELVSW